MKKATVVSVLMLLAIVVCSCRLDPANHAMPTRESAPMPTRESAPMPTRESTPMPTRESTPLKVEWAFDWKLDERQRQCLRELSPLLIEVASNKIPRELFWHYIRDDPSEINISWAAAVGLIEEGEILIIGRWHDRTVTLSHRDGRKFVTIEPEGASAVRVGERVDPTGVFIDYLFE